jgi:antitoxin MazE
MKSVIRNIGSAKGIILPESFLKECFIENEVNIEVNGNSIVISPPGSIKRKGWEQSFKEMAENGDDQLVIPDLFEDENF